MPLQQEAMLKPMQGIPKMTVDFCNPSKLLVFPILIPGESYYSLLARYERISGNLSEMYTFRQLFGNRPTLDAAVTLPYRVRLIDEKVPMECGLSSDLVIRECTAYHYLRLSGLFTDRAFEQILVARTKRGRNQRARMIRALQGSQPRHLRFCPECILSDTMEYHESYWHLVHQLEGVEYCPIHGTRLIESPWPAKEKLTHFYTAPDPDTAERFGREADTSLSPDPFQQSYLELSRVIDWLLKNAEAIGSEFRLLKLYESELGELSAEKILRQLASAGPNFFKALFPGDEMSEFEASLRQNGIIRQRPLVHALLIMSFGGIPWISKYQT